MHALRRRRSPRARFALALYLLPAIAGAHPPLRANGAAWTSSGAPALALRTNRGLVIASDSGARLLCPMALGAFPNEQLPLVAAAEGGWLVGTSRGVLHLDPHGCRDTGGARLVANGVLELVAANETEVYAITADASAGSALFHSADSGQSFELQHQLPAGEFFNSVVADANGERLFAAGERVDDRDQVTHFIGAITADGAALQPIELEPDESLVRVLAVDPALADVIVAGAFVSSASSRPSRLLRSDDAGRSWRTWQSVPGLQQMGFSADGQTAWLSTDAGLWRSDRGGPFASLPLERAPSCVIPGADQLLVCDALGLQGTRDGARSFEPLLRFADVTAPVSCDGSGSAALECRVDWQEFALERAQVFGQGSTAPDAPAPASAAPPARADGAEARAAAGCTLSARAVVDAPAAGAPLLVLAACYRRRRRPGCRARLRRTFQRRARAEAQRTPLSISAEYRPRSSAGSRRNRRR